MTSKMTAIMGAPLLEQHHAPGTPNVSLPLPWQSGKVPEAILPLFSNELVVASYGLFSAFAPEMTMSTNLEVLEAEALKLAPSDRSHLLERLIASLDSDPEVEEAWEREADRRETLLESGSVAEAPGPEAMSRLRSRLVR